MDFSIHITDWELTQPFRISNFEWINSRCLVVQLGEDGFVGRGEAQGVFYLHPQGNFTCRPAEPAACRWRT
jgi:hypothetical protein